MTIPGAWRAWVAGAALAVVLGAVWLSYAKGRAAGYESGFAASEAGHADAVRVLNAALSMERTRASEAVKAYHKAYGELVQLEGVLIGESMEDTSGDRPGIGVDGVRRLNTIR